MQSIKGAIFDVDGTLLDTMPTWEKVPGLYLQMNGITPREGLSETLEAMGGHQIPAYFRTEYKLPKSEQEISDGIFELLEGLYKESAVLKDGVLALLDEMTRRRIKLCAATATDRRLVVPALERLGILPYFGRVFTCGEERTSKKEPDIFLRAADFLGTTPEQTIVFEDALYAVKTAKSAGFKVAAVYDAAAERHQPEIRKLADFYCATPLSFLLLRH